METILEGLREISKFVMWFGLGVGVVAAGAAGATLLINLIY